MWHGFCVLSLKFCTVLIPMVYLPLKARVSEFSNAFQAIQKSFNIAFRNTWEMQEASDDCKK